MRQSNKENAVYFDSCMQNWRTDTPELRRDRAKMIILIRNTFRSNQMLTNGRIQPSIDLRIRRLAMKVEKLLFFANCTKSEYLDKSTLLHRIRTACQVFIFKTFQHRVTKQVMLVRNNTDSKTEDEKN